jgi:hypothetical protein
MLNATGCMELSGNGLRAMVQGLQFVELASSFYGFKPVEEVWRRRQPACTTYQPFDLIDLSHFCDVHATQQGHGKEVASAAGHHPRQVCDENSANGADLL